MEKITSISPEYGAQATAVDLTIKTNQGRNMRTDKIVIQAGNGEKAINVLQGGVEPFILLSSGNSVNIDSDGKSLDIVGTTNVRGLAYSMSAYSENVELPAQYITDNGYVPNGQEVFGDPGASGIYSFRIPITVGQHHEAGTVTRVLAIKDIDGIASVNLLITQPGTSYITITPKTLAFTADGQPKDGNTISVWSNTSWTVRI